MGNLKAEHEELKIKFGKFKNATDIFITDHQNYLRSNVEGTMEPNIDVEHRVISKRPARLLPLSLFQKYAISSFTDHMYFKLQIVSLFLCIGLVILVT